MAKKDPFSNKFCRQSEFCKYVQPDSSQSDELIDIYLKTMCQSSNWGLIYERINKIKFPFITNYDLNIFLMKISHRSDFKMCIYIGIFLSVLIQKLYNFKPDYKITLSIDNLVIPFLGFLCTGKQKEPLLLKINGCSVGSFFGIFSKNCIYNSNNENLQIEEYCGYYSYNCKFDLKNAVNSKYYGIGASRINPC